MNQDTTEKAANVIIAAAVIGAAVVILRSPELRRLAFRLAVTAATGTLPAWFSQEVRQAWAASGPTAGEAGPPRAI
jgi:hypothetical protein